jgi:hypothetical protein
MAQSTKLRAQRKGRRVQGAGRRAEGKGHGLNQGNSVFELAYKVKSLPAETA